MKPPIFVRSLTSDEHTALHAALRATDAFCLRRAQYLLASAKGQTPKQIATTYGGCVQSVRNAIKAFETAGLGCLTQGSHRPQRIAALFGEAELARLQVLLHQSPRTFGKETSVWTLTLLAEVSFEQGLTPKQVSLETIRRALARLGANWRRAKHWITSPDPLYALKKRDATV